MTDRKLTDEEYELVMDHVSDIYDVISEIKGRLSEIYDSAGEICDLVKCAEKVDTTNFKLKEATETDLGKICVFWNFAERPIVSILVDFNVDTEYPFVSEKKYESYKHCRRLTKKEIKELC